MTIRYRKIDGAQTAKNAELQNALKAEDRAFRAECEVDRLKAAGASTEQTSEQRRQARYLRRLAIGAVKRAKVPRADVNEVRRAFVGDWLERIEGSHAELTVELAEARASMADGQLDDDGKSRLEAEVEQRTTALEVLEKVHAIAAARWDELQGKMPKAKAGDQPPAE